MNCKDVQVNIHQKDVDYLMSEYPKINMNQISMYQIYIDGIVNQVRLNLINGYISPQETVDMITNGITKDEV